MLPHPAAVDGSWASRPPRLSSQPRAAAATVSRPAVRPLLPTATVPPSSGGGASRSLACAPTAPRTRGGLRQVLDLLGGVGSLVRDKTVTVKVNLTGWPIKGSSADGRRATSPTATPRSHSRRSSRRTRAPHPLRRIARRRAAPRGRGRAPPGPPGPPGHLRRRVREHPQPRLRPSYSRLTSPTAAGCSRTSTLNHSYEDTDVVRLALQDEGARTRPG